MKRLLAGLIVALGIVLGVGVPPAQAAYPSVPGWESPAVMAPRGTLCFETGGSTFLGPAITAAAAGWNRSDITAVARASCQGYPRNATVRFAARYDPTTTATGYVTWCARYAPGGHTWTYLRGYWVWVANMPTVLMNYTPLAMKQCHNTTGKKTSIVSHETGHWLGLSHAVGITVMTKGISSYTTATYYDIRRINGRY